MPPVREQVGVNGEGAIGARVQVRKGCHGAQRPPLSVQLLRAPQRPAACTGRCPPRRLNLLPCPLPATPRLPRAAAQVWWEGDQTFYSGILALYDAVSTE